MEDKVVVFSGIFLYFQDKTSSAFLLFYANKPGAKEHAWKRAWISYATKFFVYVRAFDLSPPTPYFFFFSANN